MANQVWFGTRRHFQWVKAPAVNVEASRVGQSFSATFQNGGAYVRRTRVGHKRYSLSWNLSAASELRKITDYAEGVYGVDTIYWLNPAEAQHNALPQYWATPSLAATAEGISLNGGDAPELIDTPTNPYGYPVQTATYAIDSAVSKPSIFIPIPPGYTAWVGAHGTAGTGGNVTVTPALTHNSNAAGVALTLIPVSSPVLVNTSFSGDAYQGISLSLGGSGTVNLTALIVQVLPATKVPDTGNFVSGQGHSGCEFADQPELTEYSAVLGPDGKGLSGLSATLVEVGAWR